MRAGHIDLDMNIINSLTIDIINKEKLLWKHKYLGKLDLMRIDIKQTIEQEIKEAQELIHPTAIFDELEVRKTIGSEIILSNGSVIKAESAMKFWAGLDYLSVAVCTIGRKLEERVAELFELDDYHSALILDSIGSVLVESATDAVNYLICDNAFRRALQVGPRRSPGYGTWQLEDQSVLFNIIPASRIGVELTEKYAMLPRKSVSFCIGMGQKLATKATTFRCRHCGRYVCKYRLYNEASMS